MTEPYPFPEKAELEAQMAKQNPTAGEIQERDLQIEEELRQLINRNSLENLSGTPDFILARYLLDCLNAFNTAVNEREKWYGRTQDRFGMPERGPLQAEINSEDNGWTKHD